MSAFRKKVYAALGYNTVFMGPGRPEFNPNEKMRGFEEYLLETAKGSLQGKKLSIDEGIIGSFMSGKFLNQGNLPGFLPFMIEDLRGKPCTAVEGACGTGGRAIAMGLRSILSDLSNTVFVAGFEMQNGVKSVYGSDILAGAAYYKRERKGGDAYFFPGIFDKKAARYFELYGEKRAREAMAEWYRLAILSARENPKAQEYYNKTEDLITLGLTKPDKEKFLPNLNPFDCSKISDGASSLILFSEEGLAKAGIPKTDAIEIVSIGEAENAITDKAEEESVLDATKLAVKKALDKAKLTINDIGVLEIHDCFTITALLAIEAIGFAEKGGAPDFILEGHTKAEGKIPTNLSGGLIGFGHPTGATGVRQLVDLEQLLTQKAPRKVTLKSPYGMMISMGGNDKTVTCLIVKSAK